MFAPLRPPPSSPDEIRDWNNLARERFESLFARTGVDLPDDRGRQSEDGQITSRIQAWRAVAVALAERHQAAIETDFSTVKGIAPAAIEMLWREKAIGLALHHREPGFVISESFGQPPKGKPQFERQAELYQAIDRELHFVESVAGHGEDMVTSLRAVFDRYESKGFPSGLICDSESVLVKEAGMDGSPTLDGFACSSSCGD